MRGTNLIIHWRFFFRIPRPWHGLLINIPIWFELWGLRKDFRTFWRDPYNRLGNILHSFTDFYLCTFCEIYFQCQLYRTLKDLKQSLYLSLSSVQSIQSTRAIVSHLHLLIMDSVHLSSTVLPNEGFIFGCPVTLLRSC